MSRIRRDPEGLACESLGSGPALLCLHGLGGGAHWFKGLAQRLQDRFRVITLDLPGTGANREGLEPFTLERCVDALVRLLRTESCPINVLGHSLGTILALRMYAAAPDRIGSLICVGGLPSVRPAMRKRLQARRERILSGGMAGLGWEAAEGVFSGATLRGNPEVAALFARGLEACDPREYLEVLDTLLAAGAEDVLPVAAAPCLVLTGSEDAYAPPADTRRFAAALPGRVRGVEMVGCGHLPFLESPRLFAREIGAFLAAASEEAAAAQGNPSVTH